MGQRVSSSRILASVFMLGAFPALAESNVDIKDLEGLFVGVDVAYNHSSVKNNETGGVGMSGNRKEDVPSDELVKRERGRCFVDPSINIGYSHFFGNWYLGLAGDVSFGKNSKEFIMTDIDEGYEAKIDGISYGVKVKGGYYVSKLDSVVYGIVGVKWREVSYRRRVDDQLFSKAKLKNPSFLLGLGFERSVCKNLSLSAEYEYSWRNSSSNTLWKIGDDSVNYNVDYNVKQKLREHSLKVGFKYHI